jgi:hypothetical protein
MHAAVLTLFLVAGQCADGSCGGAGGAGAYGCGNGPMPQTCYAPRYGCYSGNNRHMHRYPAFHGTYYRSPYNYRTYFDYPWHAGLHEPTSLFSYNVEELQQPENLPGGEELPPTGTSYEGTYEGAYEGMYEGTYKGAASEARQIDSFLNQASQQRVATRQPVRSQAAPSTTSNPTREDPEPKQTSRFFRISRTANARTNRNR